MRWRVVCLLLGWMAVPVAAQSQDQGPTNGKAQGTYKKALEHEQRHEVAAALDDFKKADKQDEGKCLGCQKGMIRYGLKLQDWKAAETAAEEMVGEAAGPKQTAISHYQYGVVLYREGLSRNKEELFARSHDEISKALAAYPNFPDAVFADGQALARMKQDDTAKARFQEFVKMRPEGDLDRQRALRYIAEPELARSRMAPPFAITTADGRSLSLDDLRGKVVLLDFWATWCGPCRAALPHMKEIVKKFQGEPLVVVSVSVDDDQSKWKEFVAKNQMTWPQYCDGGFEGEIAEMFGVHAIPHTFTIDSDGVLQDEQIGDASIEGKLKKLLAKAKENQNTASPPVLK